MKILGGIDAFMSYENILLFSKERENRVTLGNNMDTLTCFLLEIVHSSGRIKKCHKIAGPVMKITVTSEIRQVSQAQIFS